MQITQRTLLASGIRCLLRSVRIVSGAMQFTRTPYGPDLGGDVLGHKFDAGLRCRVSDGRSRMRPAAGCRRHRDDVSGFRSFMPGRMLLMVRNVAVRLPSTVARHPSSLVSSTGPGCGVAAGVGDQDVDRPQLRARLAGASSSISPSFVMSRDDLAWRDRRPIRSPACTADSAASPGRAAPPSRLPARTRFAMAAPMPRELPFTIATLSRKRFTLAPLSLPPVLERSGSADRFDQ